jgi:hypothetical protein
MRRRQIIRHFEIINPRLKITPLSNLFLHIFEKKIEESRLSQVPDFPESLTFFDNVSNNLYLKLIFNSSEFWRLEII